MGWISRRRDKFYEELGVKNMGWFSMLSFIFKLPILLPLLGLVLICERLDNWMSVSGSIWFDKICDFFGFWVFGGWLSLGSLWLVPLSMVGIVNQVVIHDNDISMLRRAYLDKANGRWVCRGPIGGACVIILLSDGCVTADDELLNMESGASLAAEIRSYKWKPFGKVDVTLKLLYTVM